MKLSTTAPAGRRRQLARAAVVGAGAMLVSGLALPAAHAAACADNTVTVTIANASLIEGDAGSTFMQFTLTRTAGPTDCEVSVIANTQGVTATAGTDFVALTNVPVSFGSNQTVATVSVPILGDVTVEGDETLQVGITGSFGAPLVAGNPGTGTILDDDPPNSPNDPNPDPNTPPQNPPAGQACVPGSPNTGNNNRGYGNSGNNNRGNCNSGNNNRGDNNTGNNNRP